MKKTLFFLVTLIMMSANVFADGLTATLQQGDKMTPFYGVDAFKNAYAAADSGAVITLSAGTFNTVNEIKKSIKIIGNFGLSATSVDRTILSSFKINANNVTVDGIYFTGSITLGNISDCKILHSWIENTLNYTSNTWHTNTVVDQCVVKKEQAIFNGKNYTIKNSTIGQFTSRNTSSNIAYITNSVIYNFATNHTNPSSGSSGVLYTPSIPVAIYKNNVLGIDVTDYRYGSSTYYYYYISLCAPSEFYGNLFAINHYMYYTTSNYYTSSKAYVTYEAGCSNSGNIYGTWSSYLTTDQYPSTPTSPGNGQDGTLRGPRGGTGFSLYPNIPRITSSKIDSNTDNDGKLNVTIKVSVSK